jgi:multidrug efflux pump subunit AcrA (membrane-fusion protein)
LSALHAGNHAFVGRSRVRTVPLSLLLLAVGCGSSGNAAKPAPSAGPRVATVNVKNGTIRPSLRIAGVVAPLRQAGIAANLNEPIGFVHVQEGDHVRAGQALAQQVTDDLEAQLVSAQRIVAEDVTRYAQLAYQTNATIQQDTNGVRSAQAVLHQAQVALAGATTDLTRYEALEAQGYLPAQTVDQQRTTVASDAAAVRTAQATLDQALANAQANGGGTSPGALQAQLQSARAAADAAEATVEQLRRQIARAVIVAPLDGVVDAVNANVGEYPLGRQLFTIEQISSVYALLPSSTGQVVQIRPGAAATVVTPDGAQRNSGKVVAVLDQLLPGTTNFTVKVLVPNPDGRLRAGMPVTATVALPPVSGSEIPVAAFVDDTRTSVYAVEDGVVKSVGVHEVKDDGTNAIVTGLGPGTTIVADVTSANVGNGDRINTAATSAARKSK